VCLLNRDLKIAKEKNQERVKNQVDEIKVMKARAMADAVCSSQLEVDEGGGGGGGGGGHVVHEKALVSLVSTPRTPVSGLAPSDTAPGEESTALSIKRSSDGEVDFQRQRKRNLKQYLEGAEPDEPHRPLTKEEVSFLEGFKQFLTQVHTSPMTNRGLSQNTVAYRYGQVCMCFIKSQKPTIPPPHTPPPI
jgi:hypothetical protein